MSHDRMLEYLQCKKIGIIMNSVMPPHHRGGTYVFFFFLYCFCSFYLLSIWELLLVYVKTARTKKMHSC